MTKEPRMGNEKNIISSMNGSEKNRYPHARFENGCYLTPYSTVD